MATTTEANLSLAIAPDPQGETRSPQRLRAAVVGATGYAGGELIRILARHPGVRITRLMADIKQPTPAESVHPVLRGHDLPVCEPPCPEALAPPEVELVFLATPHEAAHDLAPALLARGLRVIDLSAAFRLKDAAAYPRWYGFEHRAPGPLAEAVFGAPELFKEDIRRARLLANPGCYATSVILALAPILRARWVAVERGIICDSKSGATGAGRTPSDKLHFPEVNESLRAYGLFNHRHVPEMLQLLGLEQKHFLFTPHLLPINRGILSTIYVRLAEPRTLEQIVALYRDFYAGAPLVRVYSDGTLPEIQAVTHTNYFDVGFALEAASDRLIIVSALDNLGKGAAGQAVQNMNLMYGFDEVTALV
jgi:N-acetyl-gamma-glutamyl-phosphate reductase